MGESEIDRIRARVERAWYADGLYEMVGGGVMAVAGGIFLVPRTMRPLAALLVMVLMVYLSFQRRLVLRLKERVTFPRAGVAVPRLPSWWRRVAASVVCCSPMLAGDALEGMLRTAGWVDPHATSFMIVVAAVSLAVGVWYSLYSCLAAGVVGLGLSFALPLMGLRGGVLFAAFMSAEGICLLAFGAFKLRRFLRHVGGTPANPEVG